MKDSFKNYSSIKITYSILGHDSSFIINDKNEEDILSLNKFRIHYFFSENEDISSFLSQTKIKIKICDENNHNNFIVGGECFVLKNFEIYNNAGTCRRQLLKVMLFNQNNDQMELNVLIKRL